MPRHTNLDGKFLMKNGKTATITEANTTGAVTIDLWAGGGKLTGLSLWFMFGKENLTAAVAPDFNSMRWSNHAVWMREAV